MNDNSMPYKASVERTGVILTCVGMIACFFIMLYGLASNNAYIGLTGLFLTFANFLFMPLFCKLAKVL